MLDLDRVAAGLLGIVWLAQPMATHAEPAAAPAEKGSYWLLDPTPESLLRSFSPDRPAKSAGPFTVDAGHIQYEVDLASYSYQRTGRERTRTWIAPNPTLKIGVTNSLDLQVNIAPFTEVSVTDLNTGYTARFSGVSDLFLRTKLNFWGNDGGTTAFAVIPWIKAPTAAAGIGNEATEGGAIAALSISLPQEASLVINAEIDSLKNANGGGYHASLVNTIALSFPLVKDVNLTGELWSSVNNDPAGTVTQISADVAVAWTVRPNLQLDVGANFGLNRDTPQLQLYGGVAQRF